MPCYQNGIPPFMPPSNGAPPKPGSIIFFLRLPFLPPLFICLIIFCICSSCLIRRLTSSTLLPEPAAMRRLREGFISEGFSLSAGVIDRMIACSQSIWRSLISTSSSCLPTPGILERMPLSGPIFLICSN